MTAIEELRDSLRFLGVENVEEDVLSSMIETAAALGMKPSEIGDSWTAYSLNHNNACLTFENWMSYRTELNRTIANRLNRKRSSVAVLNSPAANTGTANKPRTPLAPIHPSLFEKQDVANISSPMSQDPAAIGTSVFQYAPPGTSKEDQDTEICEKWWGSDTKPPATEIVVLKQCPSPFRYMLQKPSEIVLALNDHLEFMEKHAFPPLPEMKSKDGAEAQMAAEPTTLIGRLVLACSQNEANEGNGSGVSLQSSLESSGGSETPLQILPGAISGFSVCQGQVVAVSGTMAQTSKRLFLVEKIHLPILPPLYASSSTTKDNDFVALIAAGPFSNMNSKPGPEINLKGLAAVVQRFNPNVVVLMGAFGNEDLPGALCRDISAMHSIQTTFVLVPSNADVKVVQTPVFPTEPIHDFKGIVSRDNITATSTPDPAIFDVNGALICATSVDVLRNLASSELHLGAAGGGGGDRLAKLASSVLYQRSMYPLYPQAPSVPVDWLLWRKLTELPSMPSIVILPSDLNPFISQFSPVGEKIEDPVPILVNPGRVSRRRAALVRWSAKKQQFSSGRIVRV